YVPFCRRHDLLICFDKNGARRTPSTPRNQNELPIVEWEKDTATPVAAHFGEWLNSVADAREESVETAAKMPQRLKRLLYELGFRFQYPVIGRLETGDVDAIVELIGKPLARTVRGDVDRLFDSSGKASLTLNVDEFTLAVSLRTGIYVFEAEDVFRWLRTFRDENFFADAATVSSQHDAVRDLRRAPREPALVQRGVLRVAALPAKRVMFRAASGTDESDFYLLGRTSSTSHRAPSVILHVVDGQIATSHHVEEPLNDLHIARDGTMWGLTTTHAVRISGGRLQSYPLQRPTRGRPWWYGIGGSDRVLVWGAGALLQFDGRQFVPFSPDAMLNDDEAVIAVHAQGQRISMLVCGDRVGAVARFDSASWQPIGEDQVIDGVLADLDVWRRRAYVLDRTGVVWKIENGSPERVPLLTYHQAYLTETGAQRPIHGLRAFDGGMLLGSTGGVIALGSSEPLFHAVPNGSDPVRLVRIGERSAASSAGDDRTAAIVALSGPNAWIWQKSGFYVIDMREW
ncbi:MAG TPA: hypothetical protein VM580_10330, partial [Labilithrix sp.]|nr:hypothetical protein [Labilithrix sp.]